MGVRPLASSAGRADSHGEEPRSRVWRGQARTAVRIVGATTRLRLGGLADHGASARSQSGVPWGRQVGSHGESAAPPPRRPGGRRSERGLQSAPPRPLHPLRPLQLADDGVSAGPSESSEGIALLCAERNSRRNALRNRLVAATQLNRYSRHSRYSRSIRYAKGGSAFGRWPATAQSFQSSRP